MLGTTDAVGVIGASGMICADGYDCGQASRNIKYLEENALYVKRSPMKFVYLYSEAVQKKI